MLLALIGGGIGMLLAFFIAWLQIEFHLIPLGRFFSDQLFPRKTEADGFSAW